jgi:anthranilate synthase component II
MNTIKQKKIVLIDNYDSFTYNLVHAFEELLGYPITVVKNDQVGIEEIDDYDYIILSPGPGVPDEAGITKQVIGKYGSSKCILGVCLGLQAIGEVYGSQLKNLPRVFHGIETDVQLVGNESPIFREMPNTFSVGRYHSWAIEQASLSDQLEVTGVDAEGEIMSIQHKQYKVYGVQYHPESILTELGKQILANFLAVETIE